jgi:hypothetical protein
MVCLVPPRSSVSPPAIKFCSPAYSSVRLLLHAWPAFQSRVSSMHATYVGIYIYTQTYDILTSAFCTALSRRRRITLVHYITGRVCVHNTGFERTLVPTLVFVFVICCVCVLGVSTFMPCISFDGIDKRRVLAVYLEVCICKLFNSHIHYTNPTRPRLVPLHERYVVIHSLLHCSPT